MKQLDIGSGDVNRIQTGYEGYGVDIYDVQADWLTECRVADLAIEPIPFEDDTFDLVTAHDFLEHIPPVIYLDGKKRNCMIELFNEIYRVLKNDGIFMHSTPGYIYGSNNQSVWSDPTHVYVWTLDTAHHLSGDYFGQHDSYNHKSKFKLVERSYSGSHIVERFQAIKPDVPPYIL
jgi:SAM-dependent methyltransferase